MTQITKTRRFTTDSETYHHADSGCAIASLHMGRQSNCLECPFEECVFIKKRDVIKKRTALQERNIQIKQLQKQGKTIVEIARRYGLCTASVYIILQKFTGVRLSNRGRPHKER